MTRANIPRSARDDTVRSQPSFLDVARAEKSFGAATVLGGIDLAVAQGEFVSLLGPSGCGKTTLLRIVAGLLAVDRGKVTLDGEDITAQPPHRRDVGVVFQNYALFPHLTVAENVAFGLQGAASRRGRDARRGEALPRAGPPYRLRRPLGARAVRRPAAAGRGRPRARGAAQAPAARRAVLGARPQAARDDADRAAPPAARARHDGGLRHPRPGRGAHHVGPHRGDEPRRDRAVRHARSDLSPPGDRLRAGVRRPLDAACGHGRAARRRSGRRSTPPSAACVAPGDFVTGVDVLLAVRPERIKVDGTGDNRRHRAAARRASSRARRSSSTSRRARATS